MTYIPARDDILWLDFEPSIGKEIGKYRPALVLSSKEYNQKTGMIICCPVSTSARGHKTEVPINGLEHPSVIVTNIINTLSWKDRKAKYIMQIPTEVSQEVLARVLPLIGA
jgi:mRNA interferase MazF